MEIVKAAEHTIRITKYELMDILRKHIHNTTGTIIPDGDISIYMDYVLSNDRITIRITKSNIQP